MATKKSAITNAWKDFPRSSYEWMEREDDYLLEASLNEDSNTTVLQMSTKLKRDPLLILNRVLCGDVSDMAGFDTQPGSDEECEFLGLCLAGVPVREALLWCVASEDRLSYEDLMGSMTAPDLREPLRIASACGVWVHNFDHLKDLGPISECPLNEIVRAVSNVSASFDVPVAPVVLSALLGKLPGQFSAGEIVAQKESAPCKKIWTGTKRRVTKRRTSSGTISRRSRYTKKRYA